MLAVGGGVVQSLAAPLGLALAPDTPVLAPLACEDSPLAALDGRRAVVAAQAYRDGFPRLRERGEVLFRDYGLSGIVSFDLSRHVTAGDVVALDLLPDSNRSEILQIVDPFMGGTFEDGAFDGLHMGHRALIDAARIEASERSLPFALVTFVPDPSEVLSRRNPEHLCTDDDRIRSLMSAEPDLIVAFDFTWDFSRNTYETFTLDVLGSIVRPVSIHVGEDFTFGADGAGSPADIARLGQVHGFAAHGHRLVESDGAPVSSTRIRGLLKDGRIAEASALLERQHMMRATVVDDHDGQVILSFDDRLCMPASGSYACAVVCGNEARAASICIDAPSYSAVAIPSCSIPTATASCSVVILVPLSESDEIFQRMWVHQSRIMLDSGEVARDQR